MLLQEDERGAGGEVGGEQQQRSEGRVHGERYWSLTVGSGYSKEQTKEMMLDASAASLISPMSVIVVGGLNNDKYFTEEDLAYYKAKYGENSVDEKKSAKIK